MQTIRALFCLLATVALSTPLQAASVTVGAARDNCIYAESDTLSNGAGQSFHAGKNGASIIRRGLIQFDLTGSLPEGATVDSVVLQLNMSMSQPGSRVVALHRVLANWGEGTSDAPMGEGIGAPATPGDATWSQRFFGGSQPWSAAGGDFDATASANLLVGTVGLYAWRSAGMVQDVTFWLANPTLNHGWLLIGEESAGASAKRFDSRQALTPANRPALTIYYTAGPTAAGGLPASTRLIGAVPNPCNPETTIHFETATAQRIRIVVYGVSGDEVRALLDEPVPAGPNSVLWHGDDARGRRVASGIYVVRMGAEDGSRAAHKIVLLK